MSLATTSCSLFSPEIHEQLQNIVNPDRQTLEEWPVHGAGYLGVRLQTQRDTVTWCWATHDISKNHWDTDPVDRPLCNYLERKAKVKKPTTAHVLLRYKACKGQDWVGRGPMVALAAAQLEHIVPDVTNPTKWEQRPAGCTFRWVPLVQQSPPTHLNCPWRFRPLQTKVGTTAMLLATTSCSLFSPEIQEQLQNIVNPDRQTL